VEVGEQVAAGGRDRHLAALAADELLELLGEGGVGAVRLGLELQALVVEEHRVLLRSECRAVWRHLGPPAGR
jgi:DNA-binding transcriptional ArsR family regulator